MVHGASKKRIVDGEAENSSEQVRDPDSEASEDSRLGSKDSKVSSERPGLSVPDLNNRGSALRYASTNQR